MFILHIYLFFCDQKLENQSCLISNEYKNYDNSRINKNNMNIQFLSSETRMKLGYDPLIVKITEYLFFL